MSDHCHTDRRHPLYLFTLQINEPCIELDAVKEKKKKLDMPSRNSLSETIDLRVGFQVIVEDIILIL